MKLGGSVVNPTLEHTNELSIFWWDTKLTQILGRREKSIIDYNRAKDTNHGEKITSQKSD